jgi:hypothetical protein
MWVCGNEEPRKPAMLMTVLAVLFTMRIIVIHGAGNSVYGTDNRDYVLVIVKGDISLMTPAMLHTAGMEYVFKTDKASRLLGYQPVYSVDQAIQVCCTALLRVALCCNEVPHGVSARAHGALAH